MEQRGGIYFLIAIIVVMAVMIVASLLERSLEAKLLPLVVGGAAIVLSAIELSRALLRRRLRAPDFPREAADEGTVGVSTRRYVIAGAWALSFVVGIYLLGFFVAVPLLIVAYMKSYGASWLAGIMSGILTMVFIYGVFDLLLQVGMYRGLLFSWLGA